MTSPTNEDDTREGLQFEYDQLRREIMQNFVLTMQILGGTFALSGTLWTLAFSEAVKDVTIKGVLFLFVWGIAIVASFRTIDMVRSTFMIAAYLRVFVEPKLMNPKWETRLYQLRGVYHSGGFGTFRGTEQSTYITIILGSLGFAGLNILPEFQRVLASQSSPQSVVATISALLLLFAICFLITPFALSEAWQRYNKFESQSDKTFGSIWRDIRDQESSTEQAPHS
ncbi:MAG: hypothetical protein M3437_12950 [Chloroflexota bacterium]|nr:hypothetical protein [Chloroflexota bacterium]MDQ5864847.1 hypothetical protein [Chloroflexota bacterium]